MSHDIDINDTQEHQNNNIDYEKRRRTNLIEYIRFTKPSQDGSRKGSKRRGLFVAFVEDNELYVGYSLCRKHERFNHRLGMDIAIKRARRNNHRYVIRIIDFDEHKNRKDKERYYVPISIIEHLLNFTKRCQNYYGNGIMYPYWLKENYFRLIERKNKNVG